RSAVLHGTALLSVPGGAQRLKAAAVIYEVFPDKSRTELALPIGQMVQGFDGKVGWVSMGAQIQDQTKELESEQHYGLNVLRYCDRPGYEVRPLADAQQGGKPVKMLAIADPTGHQTLLSLDPASHKVLAAAYDLDGQTTEVTFSDYRTIGGVEVAHHFDEKKGGTPVVEITLTQVEVNQPVDDGLFKKPVA
ncbi:MAG: outer membrane lipoprotein-sorting protein, partial [Acidobacteriota bacterium]|nr:outer membrane lipoprotein-sorting protein [Acidobacteriota bacterium]